MSILFVSRLVSRMKIIKWCRIRSPIWIIYSNSSFVRGLRHEPLGLKVLCTDLEVLQFGDGVGNAASKLVACQRKLFQRDEVTDRGGDDSLELAILERKHSEFREREELGRNGQPEPDLNIVERQVGQVLELGEGGSEVSGFRVGDDFVPSYASPAVPSDEQFTDSAFCITENSLHAQIEESVTHS